MSAMRRDWRQPSGDRSGIAMNIKHQLRKRLWQLGLDIVPFAPAHSPIARRRQMFRAYGIDTVVDIGANVGQFAKELRADVGFSGRILSFEPLSSAFKLLEANSKNDPDWDVFNVALGEVDEKREINIAGNSQSSSLLEMLPLHLNVAPDSRGVGRETIQVRTLDSLLDGLCNAAEHIYLKIDTQGFESKVLGGAEKSLTRVDTLQMEMSLVPLYEGELPFDQLCALMRKKGYTLVGLENGFSSATSGQQLQVDGIFHRFRADAPPT